MYDCGLFFIIKRPESNGKISDKWWKKTKMSNQHVTTTERTFNTSKRITNVFWVKKNLRENILPLQTLLPEMTVEILQDEWRIRWSADGISNSKEVKKNAVHT